MLKQVEKCGWCDKTDELKLMAQGGSAFTVCTECGSTGPILSMQDVRNGYAALRARLAEVEKERDGLKITLDIIQSGFEYRNGDPKMDGTFDRFPHVLNRSRMMDISREALAKLEEK